MAMANRNTLALGLTIGVAAIALVSCSLFEGLNKDKEGGEAMIFPHKAHKADFACTDCHAGAKKEAEAGLPKLASCLDCHEKSDKFIQELEARNKAAGTPWMAKAGESELKFHHASHVKNVTYKLSSGQSKNLECSDCHGDIAKADPTTAIPMELCTDCHAKGKPAAKEGEEGLPGAKMLACSVCHNVYRSDVRPEDHKGLWKTAHGEETKFGFDEAETKRCSYCHRKSYCTDCHSREQPRSHTRFFRLRGHGIDAGLSRERCTTCHLEDFCSRCHRSTRPLDHSGSWAGAPYRHCTGCHVPVGMTRCSVCHRENEVGHTSAPLPPVDTNHTGNCTMACHTKQHPDTGIGCKACHK